MTPFFMKCDAILIDDDPIVHALWKRAAQATGVTLQEVFPSEAWVKTIATHFEDHDRTIPIYIDSNLGIEMRGEELAKRLSELGFQNLYLTTGYVGLSGVQQWPWIRGILGKEPPEMMIIHMNALKP